MNTQRLAFFGVASLALAVQGAASPLTIATANANANVTNTMSGVLSASASAANNNGVGNSRATAAMGSLGGFATITGCGLDPLFQQPCNGAGTESEFDDIVNIVGAAAGTPVTIEFDWNANGTVSGTGGYNFQAEFIAGNTGISISNGSIFIQDETLSLGGSKSLLVDTSVGARIPITGRMDLSVVNRDCWGGSQFCNASLTWSITADASHTAALTAKVVTPGVDVQLIGDSGHNYAAAIASSVPEPATYWAIGSGLLAFGLVRRLRNRSTAVPRTPAHPAGLPAEPTAQTLYR